MSKKGPKSQSAATEQSYDIRDIVLAKVRGYPPWPGMIVDPDNVPGGVAKERPNAKSKKGSWYCVRFFPAGDYSWMVPKDMSRLRPHEIDAFLNETGKRNGELLKGYRIALDPTAWEAEREAAIADAQDEEANAEVDQLASDGEEEADDGESKKNKAKKRKRDSDAAPAKPKKAAKPKKDSAEPAASKKKAAGTIRRKSNIKSKAMVESEDEGGAEGEDEDAGPSKRSSPPPAKKSKRDKGEGEGDSALTSDPDALKVREWRHRLQKGFLNTKAVPKEEDMPAFDELFTTVEQYDKMSLDYLTFSKIGKVMRHIHLLGEDKVPRDGEFKFRTRAKVLVDKWHDILKTNGSDTKPETKPAVNGARKVNGKDEPKADAMEVDPKGDAPAANGEAKAEVNGKDGAVEDAMLGDLTMIADDGAQAGDVSMAEAA